MSRNRVRRIDKGLIRRVWRERNFGDRFKELLQGEVRLERRSMTCIKDSYKSSIWKLVVKSDVKRIRVILKISKQLRRPRPESTVERNIYRKARKILQPFMPQIYLTKRNVNGRDLWVFMEYIEPIQGRVEYGPQHFKQIIPLLAKLHASTMNERFAKQERVFRDWLPHHQSDEAKKERRRINRETRSYLRQAMKVPELRGLLQPHEALLRKLLAKGPGYFPEVTREGLSVTHGDLHTENIASNQLNKPNWQIKLIDWEGAKYAPCWYDLVYLVGVFLAYRREWQEEEEAITERAVRLYVDEMKRHGIEFKTDGMTLYRMAYLKRILERGLYLQLKWAVSGQKEAKLLPVYLQKIKSLSGMLVK
jgi:Predicted choline kinase involved in LPS biosynthesis